MRSSTRNIVLDLLKAHHQRYLSGPELAERLGLSRTAVWKQIKRLQQLGYIIEVEPRKGYRLLQCPDLLLPDEVRRELQGHWIGETFHYFSKTTSTNDEAMLLAANGAPHGTVVCAEQQSAGRGRLNRKWLTPPGSALTFSVILRPDVEPRQGPQITLAAALGITRLLRKGYRLAAAIKWPNDILISGRKVAGILTELQADQDRVKFLVVGIGINVNQVGQDFQGSFRYPPTSLRMELNRRIRRVDLLAQVLKAVEADLERMSTEGFDSLVCDLKKYSAVLGKEIELEGPRYRLIGRVLGFTPEGALRLIDREGEEHVAWAGDIIRVVTALGDNPDHHRTTD